MRKYSNSAVSERRTLYLGCRNRLAHPLWRIAAGILAGGIYMAMPSILSAQSKSDSRRFTASVSAGIARPSDQAFRDLYGSLQLPISIQADYGLSRKVVIFGEYGYVRSSGKTQSIDEDVAPGGDALQFRAHSVNVGLLYVVPVRKLAFLMGGGLALRFYRESLPAAGMATSGNKSGFGVQGGLEYELAKTFALVGRIDYSRIEIKAASSSENDVSLGRLEASLGLSFRLNRLLHK